MPAPVAASIPAPIVSAHLDALAQLMRSDALDAVLLFGAANMLAFTGTSHTAWDRLTCGVVTRDGRALIVCPRFERPTVASAEPHATIHTWEETEDPFQTLADALAAAGVKRGRLGLDGLTWISTADALAAACPDLQLVRAEPLLREVRICKTPAEIALLREAQRRGEQIFAELAPLMQPGAAELELLEQVRRKMAARGVSVQPMIQSGPNGAIPHNPTGRRRLETGDTVVVDSTITHDGYYNDLTRTFAIGLPPERARRAYRAVREAQQAAIAAARPGVECRALDALARRVIADHGFGEYFSHRLGHGMGIECHEPPYLNGANPERLRAGMCVTIEPGVYVPGEFGIRIEDDVVITESGCEVLRSELQTDVSAALLVPT